AVAGRVPWSRWLPGTASPPPRSRRRPTYRGCRSGAGSPAWWRSAWAGWWSCPWRGCGSCGGRGTPSSGRRGTSLPRRCGRGRSVRRRLRPGPRRDRQEGSDHPRPRAAEMQPEEADDRGWQVPPAPDDEVAVLPGRVELALVEGKPADVVERADGSGGDRERP